MVETLRQISPTSRAEQGQQTKKVSYDITVVQYATREVALALRRKNRQDNRHKTRPLEAPQTLGRPVHAQGTSE
jgi:hypothetical protein